MVLDSRQFNAFLKIGNNNLCYTNGAVSCLDEGSFWTMELATMLMELLFGDTFLLIPHRS